MEGFVTLIAMAVMAAFFGFPIYVLVRLSVLGRDVDVLKTRVGQLERETNLRQEAVMRPPMAGPIPQSVPVPARPTQAAPSTVFPSLPIQPPPPPVRKPVPELLSGLHAPSAPLPSTITTAPPTRPSDPPFDLEKLVGANWLAKLGIAAIAIGVAFFLQYAFRNGWIGPTAQVGIGLAVSAGLMLTAQIMLPKPQYRAYAQVLASGGIIVYFLSVYAGYAFYQPRLIGYGPAFAALAVGALVASALALANNTQAVAVLCVLGAFAAPVLIRETATGTSADSLFRLYAYIAAIDVWALILIRVRAWHSLAVVSIAATWLLFFGAGPIQGKGWLIEGFAGLFLLGSCWTGIQALSSKSERSASARAARLSDEQMAGVGLIVAGCLAFAASSVMILGDSVLFGISNLAIVGMLLTFVIAMIPLFVPKIETNDREIRHGLSYLSGFALAAMLLIATASTQAAPAGEAPVAFGFCLFNYLLFIAVAFAMSRRADAAGPAAGLLTANAVVHISMARAVLGNVRVFGVPAFILWLPIAGLVAMLALAVGGNKDKESFTMLAAFAGTAIAFPVIAAVASLGFSGWPASAAWMFAAEFMVLSASFVVMRHRIARPQFRADLVAPLANAAAFFILIERCLGMQKQGGLVLLAIAAVAFAAYHAVIGGIVVSGKDEDHLRRLIYLGIGVTFATIAIPLQLKAGYVTLAWAAEACALVYAGILASERRARWFGYGVFALAACKAMSIDLLAEPNGAVFLANSRMLAGSSIIAAAYLTSVMLRRGSGALRSDEKDIAAVLIGLANLFALVFVSVDLWDFVGRVFASSGTVSAQQLSLSLFWAVYALTMVSVGMWKRSRPVRLFAMGLLYVSIFKVFLLDLNGLKQPYKIVSFLVLGVILLVISLLYTRFEGRIRGEER